MHYVQTDCRTQFAQNSCQTTTEIILLFFRNIIRWNTDGTPMVSIDQMVQPTALTTWSSLGCRPGNKVFDDLDGCMLLRAPAADGRMLLHTPAAADCMQLLPATSNHRRLRQTSPSRCWTFECGDVRGLACGAVGLLLDDLAIINVNHENSRSPCKASPLTQGFHPPPPIGKDPG